MIFGKISDSARIEALHPALQRLFEFVKTHDLMQLPLGRNEIDGDRLYINIAENTLVATEAQKLEVHRAYMDVHLPLNNVETIGWRALSTIDVPSEQPFDEASDYALYAAPATSYVDVHPGEYLIAYPEDAHAPLIGEGSLRKAVAKIKL